MHVPKPMQLNDKAQLQHFIREHGFAVLVSSDLQGSHIPLQLAADEGEWGTLYGHLAKVNPHWKVLDGQSVLVMFSGPHAYISPRWYQTTPAVPTWNYVAVHCQCVCHLLDETQTQAAIDRLVAIYEPDLLHDQSVMTDDYQARLRNAVVGIKLDIQHMQGQEKLGQDKKPAVQQRVYKVLKDSRRLDDQQLAAYMQARNLGTGD